MEFSLPARGEGESGFIKFAEMLGSIDKQIGFKLSARGWCYQLEGFGLITKAQFNRIENILNKCRAKGYLAIDFTAEEEARQFSGIEIPQELTPAEYLKEYLRAPLRCEEWYTPDWWDGEEYYIQMVVEKIDLKTLFSPVCSQYHIPIATSKGWSSMLQRAEYAKRFQEAEDKGLGCVLLYCGDHDPDGLRISDFLYTNLKDLEGIRWSDGTPGYNPDGLVISRFGLDYAFIEANGLTWIDNLITGSKKDLASPSHPNHLLPYVQDYIKTYGTRKCEANALVVRPAEAEGLVRDAVESHLGITALDRFEDKHGEILERFAGIREEAGIVKAVKESIALLDNVD